MFHLIVSILCGAFVGYVAGRIRHESRSFWMNCLIGIVGSFLGGLICGLIGIYSYGFIFGFIVNVLGALLLLWLVDKFQAR